MIKRFRNIVLITTLMAFSMNVCAQDIENIDRTGIAAEQNITDDTGQVSNVNKEIPINEEVPIDEEVPIIDPSTEGETISMVPSIQNKQVVLTLNNPIALVEGKEYVLNTAPKVTDGRTYLPLRFVVDQILGAQVQWNGQTKEVTVSKDNKVVILTAGLKTAFIDDMPIEIEAAPIIEKGTTLLPIRFLSEQFNIDVVYNTVDKTVTLTKIVQEEIIVPDNTPPIAQFGFGQDTYIAGQAVTTIDGSYDEDGDAIIEKQWQINKDPSKVTPNLSSIFNTPREGIYEIGLRVKDSKGTWSEWYTEFITINPNQKPVVTELKPKKDSYARGEKLEFDYLYENEEWESIKAERWSYRPVASAQTTMTPIKPEAIFHKGEYIITLQLEDTYGNLGDKKEATVTINDTIIQTEFEYKFTKGKIGDTIDNFDSVNYRSFKEVFSSEIIDDKGTLIMSDSPEVVTQKGILYQQTASGNGRVLIHHISDFPLEDPNVNNKRLVVMVSNPNPLPASVTLSNKAIKGPTDDILHLGQRVVYTYFMGSPQETLTIAPNSYQVIYDNGKSKWSKTHSISGIFDFSAESPVTFTVAVLDPEDKLESINQMNKPAKDIHPRGTFDITNKHYTLDLTNESVPTALLIGNGTQDWVNGVDALTGEIVQNRGNFGVEYHIKVTAKEDTALIINPRGNAYKGAIKWKDDQAYLTPSAGYFTGGRDRAAFGGIILAGQTREFIYMLPNGSAAPVLFGFIPKSEWSKY